MTAVAPAEAATLLRTAREKLGAELIAKLSAPFILATPNNWWSAPRRLIFYGQETKGWGGENQSDPAAGTLQYWLDGNPEERAKHLARLYTDFHGDGPNRTSPFWRARKKLVGDLQNWALGWSNLMRVDVSPYNRDCGTWKNLSWEELWAICAWQRDLHHAELSTLRPDAAIFFTGPNYDCCICRTFAQSEFQKLSGYERNVAVRVSSPALPHPTFRTYHPRYLDTQRLPLLAEIAALLPR